MRILTTTFVVAGLGLGGGAYAADIKAQKYTAPAPIYLPVDTWAGFYIGGNIGGLFNTGDESSSVWKKYRNSGCDCSEAQTTGNSTYISAKNYKLNNNRSDDEFIGGVHLGYNWQSGAVVSGLEGDVDFGENIDYLASIRGRLGLAYGDTLVYATGGVAFIGFSNDFSLENTGTRNPGIKATFSRDQDEVGFVVGGGIERKITRNWSIGVEALYYNFDSSDMNKYAVKYTDKYTWQHTKYVDSSLDNEFVAVRGRLTYHVTDDYVPLK